VVALYAPDAFVPVSKATVITAFHVGEWIRQLGNGTLVYDDDYDLKSVAGPLHEFGPDFILTDHNNHNQSVYHYRKLKVENGKSPV
jgi:hypothetical protein